jgi:hypothetical protein
MNHHSYFILKDILMDLEFLEFEYEMGMNKLEQMIVMNKLDQMIVMSNSSNHSNYHLRKQIMLLLKL